MTIRNAVITLAVGSALTAAPATRAQDTRTAVRLVVTVSDSATPHAPVPRFILLLYRSTGESVPALTNEHGVAIVRLAPGQYRVTSFQPYVWHGRRFNWSEVITVDGDSGALALNEANARTTSAPDEGWPPAFATRSGRPEITVGSLTKPAAIEALIAATADEGWTLRSMSAYLVVVARQMTDWGRFLLGSAFNPNPEWRESFTLLQVGDSIRIVGSVAIIRNPGSAYEAADDATSGRAGRDLQAQLDRLKRALASRP
jgi:hypothetical protein